MGMAVATSETNLKLFEHICLATVTAGAAFLMFECGMLARDARLDLQAVTANVNTLVRTLNTTAAKASDASEQIRLAATAGAAAASEQRTYWSKTSLETYKTMASLRLAIVRTNTSLNDEIFPRVALALDNTNTLSSVAAMQLQKTMDELHPALANLTRASAAAADAMSDPAIHQALSHADEATARAAAAADQTAQVAAHLNDASRDFAAYVHRMTSPVRGTWATIEYILGFTAKARQAGGI